MKNGVSTLQGFQERFERDPQVVRRGFTAATQKPWISSWFNHKSRRRASPVANNVL